MLQLFRGLLSYLGGESVRKKASEKTKAKIAPQKLAGEEYRALKTKEEELIKLLEEVHRREGELGEKVRALQDKERYLQGKEQSLAERERHLTARQGEIEELRKKQLVALEKIAALSRDEAREQVMKIAEKDLTVWLAKRIEETKEALKANEEELSREILADALKHGVTDFVAEYTVSSVSLPNEELKGKIIGREGRNIRAFEKATGVELDLDEVDEVRLSSFDSIRREIARIALQRLIRDGRIQPTRIENVVEQTRQQMDKILLEEGKKICQAVGVYNFPTELIKAVGKYKYRFSYGQNLAIHTIEETKIGTAIAHELKADVKTVRLGCLLHDIGKVITEEEGSHVQVGVDFLRRFSLPEKVIACVAEHHEDKPFSCVEAIIVWIADAASGSRPGARYQAHEEYLKRMTHVEELVRSFEGVKDVAAYQAGREIRVVVDPERISDEQLTVLVHKIGKQLSEEAKWAGQIKVTAIRELRETTTVS